MSIVSSIDAEYRRYKALAEGAIAQLDDAHLSASGPNGSSSIAVIVWHVAGNLRSRFTDFLDSDGEKPWRHRDEEFEDRTVTRADLTAKWESGWQPLLSTLAGLGDDDLTRHVSIRGPVAARLRGAPSFARPHEPSRRPDRVSGQGVPRDRVEHAQYSEGRVAGLQPASGSRPAASARGIRHATGLAERTGASKIVMTGVDRACGIVSVVLVMGSR